MQGWTPDFIPKLTDDAVAMKMIDRIVPISGPDAIRCAKELATREGIFVGITSGATLAVALKIAGEAEKGSTILALLPDTGEAADRSAREQCVALHFETMHLLGSGEPLMSLSFDAPVAYLLAASIPADLNFQQALLAMRSDQERTETLSSYYRAILPKLRSGAKASERASTNGHVM